MLITRLNGGFIRSAMRSRLYMRMARAATAGGANWVKSCSASAGMAANCSFAAVMACCTRRRRFTGSASLVARSENSAETRFWKVSSSLPLRTLIGTMATRLSSGRQSCSCR